MANQGYNLWQLVNNPDLLNGATFDKIRNSPYLREYLEGVLKKNNIKPTTNDVYQLLKDMQQIDRSRSQSTEYKNFDSDVHFTGFTEKPGHISITGTTGVGKTTLLQLLLAKETISVPKTIYVFMSSFGLEKFKTEMQKILTYAYMKQSNSVAPPDIYIFKDYAQELVKAISQLKSQKVEGEVLFIMDDVRGTDKKSIMTDIINPFLHVAKNANCRVVYMDHEPNKDKGAQRSLSYIILCDPDARTYNSVIHSTETSKIIDPRFNTLNSLVSKSIIYDRNSRGVYWAFANMPMLKTV